MQRVYFGFIAHFCQYLYLATSLYFAPDAKRKLHRSSVLKYNVLPQMFNTIYLLVLFNDSQLLYETNLTVAFSFQVHATLMSR